ncbi:MAG: 16S rRNA (uracil(1498)-N(3))-methyltransferase [Candidatus Zixiibacteriota bacterium]|nr:MAG: 16S rRNA (uracil(1498)-N(3))-methyltransferase [candidate division Zixibacteria bacterium]
MNAPIFFAEASSISDNSIRLSKTESHHASRVLRLKVGDIAVVVDGLGNAYRGEMTKVPRSGQVEMRIHSHTRNYGEPNVILSLASGLSAGHKFDHVIEKGTELGVKRFVPLITEKAKVKMDDPKRTRSRLNRYEKVALAAMKQCRRSYRPDISAPILFTDYLNEIDPDSVNLLFHPGSQSKPLDEITLPAGPKRVNLMVGSESGFSADEVDLARSRGITIASLGKRILRAETAGPVVCALIMGKLGELR